MYVFESDKGIECMGDDFVAQTDTEMIQHLKEHQAKGDHIRPSLLRSR